MNRLERKKLKEIVGALEDMVGSYATGLLIAGLVDSVQAFVRDGGGRDVEIRKIDVTFNGFREYPLFDERDEACQSTPSKA